MTTHSQRALLALLLLATGCRFTFLQDDLERIQRRATLAGDVVVDDWEDAPVVIAVIEPPDRRGDPIRMLRSLVLERPGRYAFQLEEGDYVVVAFEDVNRNARIDEGEQGTWLPAVHLDVRQEVHDHHVRIDRKERNGHDHITMGTAGGVWHMDGPGTIDHILWVSMTDDGPELANITLEGVFDREGPEGLHDDEAEEGEAEEVEAAAE